MIKNISFEEVKQLFESIVKGEPWAKRVEFEIDDKWISAHLAYSSNSYSGLIRLPPYQNILAIAYWIAHECGHIEDYDKIPPKSFENKINRFIRNENAPTFIISLIRAFYYLVFWKEMMRRELFAHQVAVKLLTKASISLDSFQYSKYACKKLVNSYPWYAFIERLFHKRLQKAEDKIIRFAKYSNP